MLKLGCVNCGAPLEIGSDMDVFACGYCGTQQQVQRKGGTVALKRVEAAIQAVQRGTDRTAAELAMPRLAREMTQLQEQRAAAIAQAKDHFEGALRGRRMLTIITFVVVFFALPAFVGSGAAGPGGIWGIPLTLGWLVACVMVPRYVYKKVKLPPDATATVAADFDQRIANVQAHIDANRRILDRLPV